MECVPCKQDGYSLICLEYQLLLDSSLSAVEIASFQKNPIYEPAGRAGRVLSLVEMLVTSTCFALFRSRGS